MFSFFHALLNITHITLFNTINFLQSKTKVLITKLRELLRLVNALALFSDNEELDDINTQDLRFLLVRPLLADVLLKQTVPPGETKDQERLALVKESIALFTEYLEMCEIFNLLKDQDKSILINQPVPVDAQAKRAAKIASFKREKETKAKLELLLQKASHSGLAKANSGKISDKGQEEGEEAKPASATTGMDEEAERELTITVLDWWIIKAGENIGFAKQELELLEHAIKSRENNQNPRGNPDDAAQASTSSKNASKLSFKPFTITRDMIQRNMFGYGYSNLPTMTIDEFLKLEEERGNLLKGGGNDEESKRALEDKKIREEEDPEENERATMKAREWDEYKDDNPRGLGNRYNRS